MRQIRPDASLKERSLGIDVFGREPDYDTNLDHVVRTTAGEVRKRLQQYYQERGREDEIVIDLPSGSYVPTFRPAAARDVSNLMSGRAVPEARTSLLTRSRTVMWLAAVASALVAGLVLGFLAPKNFASRTTAIDRFWAPVAYIRRTRRRWRFPMLSRWLGWRRF